MRRSRPGSNEAATRGRSGPGGSNEVVLERLLVLGHSRFQLRAAPAEVDVAGPRARCSPRSRRPSSSIGAFTSRPGSSNPTSATSKPRRPPRASTPAPITSSSTSTSQSRKRPSPASSRATSGSIRSTPAVSAPEPPLRAPAGMVEPGERPPGRARCPPLRQPAGPARPASASPRCRCRARWRKCELFEANHSSYVSPDGSSTGNGSGTRGAERVAGRRARSRAGAGATGSRSRMPCELDDGRTRMRRGQSGGRELDRLALCPWNAPAARRPAMRRTRAGGSASLRRRRARRLRPCRRPRRRSRAARPPAGAACRHQASVHAGLENGRPSFSASASHPARIGSTPGEVDDQLGAAQAYRPCLRAQTGQQGEEIARPGRVAIEGHRRREASRRSSARRARGEAGEARGRRAAPIELTAASNR